MYPSNTYKRINERRFVTSNADIAAIFPLNHKHALFVEVSEKLKEKNISILLYAFFFFFFTRLSFLVLSDIVSVHATPRFPSSRLRDGV